MTKDQCPTDNTRDVFGHWGLVIEISPPAAQKNGGRNFALDVQQFRPPVRLTILPESAERGIADTLVCESTSADHGQSVNQ